MAAYRRWQFAHDVSQLFTGEDESDSPEKIQAIREFAEEHQS